MGIISQAVRKIFLLLWVCKCNHRSQVWAKELEAGIVNTWGRQGEKEAAVKRAEREEQRWGRTGKETRMSIAPLRLEGTSKIIKCHPRPWAGLPPTSSGCPGPHPPCLECLQGWGTHSSLGSSASASLSGYIYVSWGLVIDLSWTCMCGAIKTTEPL